MFSPATHPVWIFVAPVVNRRNFLGFSHHLGTAYIRAFLHSQGVSTEQFTHPGDLTLGETAAAILERHPVAVGLTYYKSNEQLVHSLATEIKRQSNCVRIICGGPQATFCDAAILRQSSAVDVCVRSYGEFTALELTEWLGRRRSLDSIAGITFRRSNKLVRTPDRRLSGSLDILPDPYLEGSLSAELAPELGLVTSRGCRFNCAFCGGLERGTVRFHSAERVLSVLRFLDGRLESGGSPFLITIGDDNLGFDRRRLHSLLEKMASERFRNIRFYAQMRTESLREDTFPLLRRAGFAKICFGLESGVPRVLAAMGKVRAASYDADAFRKEYDFLGRIAWCVAAARDAGLHTKVSIILGFPGETEEEARRTLAFVERLGCDEYSHNFFAPCAGSIAASLPSAGGYVHRLPVLSHADNYHGRMASEMGGVLRLLSDNWHSSSVVGVPPHLPAAAWSRLRSELPLCAQAWTLDGSGFRHLAPHSVHLTLTEAVDCQLVAGPDSAAPCENAPTVHVWPLSRIEWPKVPGRVRGPWDSLLISIEGREDVEALERLAGEWPRTYTWQIPPAIGTALTCIQDACRWGSADCPAASGRRWLAGEHGNLRPCCKAPAGTEWSSRGSPLPVRRAGR